MHCICLLHLWTSFPSISLSTHFESDLSSRVLVVHWHRFNIFVFFSLLFFQCREWGLWRVGQLCFQISFFHFYFLQFFFALLFRKSSPLFWSTALCHVPSTIDSLSPAQYVSRSLGCFLSLESYLIHNPAAPLCVSCACDWVWFYCHLRQVKANIRNWSIPLFLKMYDIEKWSTPQRQNKWLAKKFINTAVPT